jgi:UPF0755 protein
VLGSILIPGSLAETTTIIVPHGATVHEIAGIFDKNGIIINPFIFRLAARLVGHNQLKSGEYEIPPHASAADIALMMLEGRSVIHLFTAAEGLTSAEIAKLLKDNPALFGDFKSPAEGSLLPESYRYSYGDTRTAVIARMQKAMQETLDELWPKRDPNLPIKTPAEAVIMASVIEKETGKATERPRIASVFYNRLRQNMRLQSDPTVIYAITQAKGPMDHGLNHDDLAFASPVNTYTSDGLPPQPICNPGRASLEAALHPETSDYLYFVADGTGGHVFAKTLAEHNMNVTKWNEMKTHP